MRGHIQKEYNMGFMDKIKDTLGKGKNVDADQLKDTAGGVKDKAEICRE